MAFAALPNTVRVVDDFSGLTVRSRRMWLEYVQF